MIINFNKIRWKNFLSTGNDFIEVNLQTPGITLIIGKNGSGKSTILDALTFALFGKAFRNINKPQLVNSITKANTIVELEFVIGKNEYKIVRGLKPNVFKIFINGSLLNQTAETKDYQDILEKNILRFSYKTFCQVVILGSASYIPFMQLPLQTRREIIESIFDLEIFSAMNIILKQIIAQNDQEISNNQIEAKINNEKILLLKKHLIEIQNKNKEYIQEKYNIIKSCERKIHENKEIISQLQAEKNILLQSVTQKEEYEKKLHEIKLLISKLSNKSNIIQTEISFFEKNDICPTCKQNINEEFKHFKIQENKSALEKIKAAQIELHEKQESFHNLLLEIIQTQQKIVEIEKNITMKNTENSVLKKQIETTNYEIEKLNEELQFQANNESIADLEKRQIELVKEYNELMENRLIYNNISSLLKDEGIKTKIINQYIPVINKLINKYLSDFDLFVDFQFNEQFKETIKSRFRDDFTYESFSEGEKQKIDLAIMLTWRTIAKTRNSLNTNLLILDEIIDSSLDLNSTDDLLKILYDHSKNNSVFVISHRESLHDKFNNVLKFTKTKNFTTMNSLKG